MNSNPVVLAFNQANQSMVKARKRYEIPQKSMFDNQKSEAKVQTFASRDARLMRLKVQLAAEGTSN